MEIAINSIIVDKIIIRDTHASILFDTNSELTSMYRAWETFVLIGCVGSPVGYLKTWDNDKWKINPAMRYAGDPHPSHRECKSGLTNCTIHIRGWTKLKVFRNKPIVNVKWKT